MAGVWHDKEPACVERWVLAERFGWSLEYIDALPQTTIMEFLRLEQGRAMIRGSIIGKGGGNGKENR